MVFKKDNNTVERPSSSELYCKGYDAGAKLMKIVPKDKQELATEILHEKILEQPHDVFYQAALAGFCYEIERIKIKERNADRMNEIGKINDKGNDKEQGIGR